MVNVDEIVFNDDIDDDIFLAALQQQEEEQDKLVELVDMLAEQKQYREEEESYMRYVQDTKYNANGVEIIASAESMNYVLITENYQIYWYVDPSSDLIVYDLKSKDLTGRARQIFDEKRPFDISYFAVLKDSKLLPGQLEVVYSSAAIVDSQIEKIMAKLPVRQLRNLQIYA